MNTSKALGIFYIWIDCFCIIQGTSDWDLEAGRMCDVYANALVNLGAAHGTSPLAGCFVRRNPVNVKKRVIRWQPTPPVPECRFNVWSMWDRSSVSFMSGSSSPEKEAIYQRGWIVQERILSPRMLHFGKVQISWECPTSGVLNESTPYAMTDTSRIHTDMDLGPGRLRDLLDPGLDGGERLEQALTYYYRIVSAYTHCDLTYQSDVIPAVLGIADFIARALRDEFLVGHFAKSLSKALHYHVSPSMLYGGPTLRPGEYPYWSWARYQGAIDMPFATVEDDPGEILATYVTTQNDGLSDCGTLYCIGRLLYITTKDNDRTKKRAFYYAYVGGFLLGKWDEIMHTDLPDEMIHDSYAFPICAKSSHESLPLGHPAMRSDDTVFMHALLLVKTPNGTFQRRGLCDIVLNDMDSAVPVTDKAFLKVYLAAKPSLVALV